MTAKIRDLTGLVVAGGKSSRMGQDKAFLDWQGRPLIQAVVESLEEYVSEVIVVAKDKEKFEFLKVPVYQDRQPEFSPLVGIATGLFHSRTELNFVLACDMPQVKMGVVKRLYESVENFDAALPRSSYGLEPLCAVYRKSSLGVFETRIRQGSLSVRDALEDLRVTVIPFDEETPEEPLVFMNLNTPAEYGEGLKND